MEDNFTKAESKGRAKLKQDYDSSPCTIVYEFTKYKYDKLDSFATAYTTDKDLTYAVEIKFREIPIDLYYDEGFIMEYNKYEALMEACTNSGYSPLYICYFNDGRIVWDITKIDNVEERWITKYCTKTTAENYKKGDIPKKVILLSPQEGKVRRTITE